MRSLFFATGIILSTVLSLNSYAAPIKPHFPDSDILPAQTRVGLIAKSSGSVLLSQNQSMLFPPASTLKLITALAAKLELGDKFQFQTKLERSGNDVILSFSGDPSLTTQDVESLFEASQIKQIKGDLILDQSAFSGYNKGVGLPWDTTGVCYTAPSTAMTLNGNCVMGSIYTNKDGSTRTFVPDFQPINVSSNAKSVTRQQQKDQFCDLELAATQTNQYHLSGCLVKRDKPLPLNFAIQNPFLYSSAVIHQVLKNKGITLSGTIKQAKAPLQVAASSRTTITTHYSQPLPVLLEHMLKDSDNLYADNLTKTLGAHYFKQAGSFQNGTEAIKQILKTKAKISLKTAVLEDGSGLSRNNRVTPDQMYSVLKYIKSQDHKLNLIQLMPTAGETGTLQYRSSMRKAPIKGEIIAKSGSLFATHNMAGYVLDSSGKPSTMFVQFVTDYHPQSNTSKISPLTQFEQAFYQNLIKATKD